MNIEQHVFPDRQARSGTAMRKMIKNVSRLLLSCAGIGWLMAAKPAELTATTSDAPVPVEYKFTASSYQSSVGNDATDFNLRINQGQHTGWVGRYADANGFTQERIGYDNRQDFGLVRLVSTIEFGSGGYKGVAVATEIGTDTYAIAGMDRTNLRSFYNLGFDPSDAVVFGAGTRALAGSELSLFQVRENRLNTQRRAIHLVWRYKPAQTQRLTLEASHKSGIDDDARFVKGYALSATYDYGQYFARLARDQYANFSASHLTRVAVGMHF